MSCPDISPRPRRKRFRARIFLFLSFFFWCSVVLLMKQGIWWYLEWGRTRTLGDREVMVRNSAISDGEKRASGVGGLIRNC